MCDAVSGGTGQDGKLQLRGLVSLRGMCALGARKNLRAFVEKGMVGVTDLGKPISPSIVISAAATDSSAGEDSGICCRFRLWVSIDRLEYFKRAGVETPGGGVIALAGASNKTCLHFITAGARICSEWSEGKDSDTVLEVVMSANLALAKRFAQILFGGAMLIAAVVSALLGDIAGLLTVDVLT